MRILTLHAPVFADAWRDSHDVITWGVDPTCDLHPADVVMTLETVLASLPAGWTPDRIVVGDDGRLPRVLGLERGPCPTALVSRDPRAVPWHAPLAAAVDVAFAAQRSALGSFAEAGAAARWLPPWAPDGVPAPVAQKEHAIAFVGTLDARAKPRRAAFFAALRDRGLMLHAVEGRFDDVYSRSTLVIDHAEHGELNARIFEAMACGALVLAPRADNGLLDLFRDGEDLITYPAEDVDGLLAALARHAAHPGALPEIVARGRETVRAGHLACHRAAAVLEALGEIDPAGRRSRTTAGAYRVLAAQAERLMGRYPASSLYRRLRAAYLDAAATAPDDGRDAGGAADADAPRAGAERATAGRDRLADGVMAP